MSNKIVESRVVSKVERLPFSFDYCIGVTCQQYVQFHDHYSGFVCMPKERTPNLYRG